MAKSSKKTSGKPRRPSTFVVYRGVPLANTAISRSARVRELYEAMKEQQDGG